MTVLSAHQDPTAPAYEIPAQIDEAASLRTAAQWLVAAAGAVGAVLVAGLQIGDVGKLADEPLLLAAALVAFLTAMLIVGFTIRAAGLVLVVSRTTVSDLLSVESKRRGLRRPNIIMMPPDRDMAWVLDEIFTNREWLLPDHDSTASLYEAYNRARTEATKNIGNEDATATAADLARRLSAVCTFARGELTRRAYRRLFGTVTGWPGWMFTAAVVIFAVSLGLPRSEAAGVSAAYRLDVLLTGTPAALQKAGLAADCRTGLRLTGVALDGTLTEPAVVTEAHGQCPASRFTVTEDVGIPVPYVGGK